MKAKALMKINKLITPLSVMTKTPGHLRLEFLAAIHQPGHLLLLQSVATPQLGDQEITQLLVMIRLLGAHQETLSSDQLQLVVTNQPGLLTGTQLSVMMRVLGAHQETELLILSSAVILLLGHQFPLMLNLMRNLMKSLMKSLMKNLKRNLQKMMKKKEMISQEKMMKLNDLFCHIYIICLLKLILLSIKRLRGPRQC